MRARGDVKGGRVMWEGVVGVLGAEKSDSRPPDPC